MLSVTPTPVELIDDDTATKYYNEFDTLEGAERESRAEALRLWADQKDADQKREQFDTLNKIYSDFDGYVNEAGLQDFDEDSRYNIANRQFIASQFDQTPEEQQDIYSSFRDKWTESVAGKKGMSEKETFDLIKQGIDARNEVTEAANQIPGDIALSLFDSIGGGDPVDVPKLIETWKTKNAESIKKLPPGWEAPLLESAQAFHTETEGMLRDYAEPLKKVYDHLAAVTGRDTERAGETNPKNQEEMDSMVDTLASMPKPVRERAYASVVLGAQKAGQDPKTFMEQWGESWSRTLNMVRTGALTAQEMAAESDLRMLEDKASPPDYYISKSTGEKIPLANRAFYDEADLRKVTPEEIAAEADQARQKVKRFEVVRELQSVADNQFDPIEKINKGGFLGFMEAMAYGSPQGLAYTATALVPVVGPYAAGAAMFSDEYNQLRQQGMSVDQAVQVGSVSAAVQAGLERTGAKALFGKLPAFEKLMRKIGNPARVGKAGSAGVRFLAAATGEQLVEGAQDLTTPLVQDVSEALGADVPDVKWQPILEKWGGSRLDVLAASLPTILLGTGVATFADNKRFAQFEERQDRYRMTGMDDATIKEIEDGKDLAEVQQNFQTAFGKLTPENVKAGIAYMEGKIASAQEQQQDPNTHTLTRETLADGSKKFVIRDPKGDVRYSTADEQTAQIALRELLRTQITGTTRGIFESMSFFNQMNEAAGRGEDIQKFLLSDAPRTLLTDYEANPTEKNLDNLFATVRSQGQDINEPAELANFPVLASNQGTLVEGVFRSIIQIQDGATGDKVVRDFSQDNLKRAIAEGRITMDWVRENLNQVIPLIESERNTGPALRTETDTDVIESFSDVALAYMTGRIREEQIPAGFRGFLRRMAIIVKDIFRRSYNLKRAIAEGKVDSNFESFLADSVGLNQQARVDTARERVSNEVLTDTNYSIGTNPFPMEQKGKWWANEDFEQRGGRISTMSPDQFLSQVRPLEVDDASRDNIDDLKNMMQSGRKLDPLAIYADGKEDGRHRAIAAKELGITSIPVIDFRQPVSTDTNNSGAAKNTPDWHSSPDEFQKHWTDRGVVNSTQIYGGGKYIKPGKIIVGEGSRNSGLGTEFMRDLTAFADSKAMQIRVTPSKDFGATSVDRLKKFYKRFGFVENSGRNKDYEISDTMYRRPSPGATNYSIGKKQDADYLAAVERGDMETVQKMVEEAAKAAGYLPHGDFRDSHTAPSGPEGADEEVKNGDADASLVQVARGVHIQPDDYFDPRVGPRYYSYQDKAGMEAFKAIRAAMDEIQQGKKALVTVFRAVPNDIKGSKLENRDWVTPSKTYAVDHGEARFGEGEYRIIKESIPAENLFWDGNDIREWGKDDGKDYAYKNTKNNRKLIAPVTYDENGNVIPLSQRFNPRSADINYSIGPRSVLSEIDKVLDMPENPTPVPTAAQEGGKVRSIAKLFQKIMAGDSIKYGSLNEEGMDQRIAEAGNRMLDVLLRASYEFPNFASWYESRLKMALDIFTQLDPDVAKPDDESALLITLAITSNGADVATQTEDGWDVYNHWKQSGRLAGSKEKRGSQRGAETENKLVIADKMAEALGGYAKLGEFLNRKGTVSELRAAMANQLGGTFTKEEIQRLTNGELVDEIVPFSLIFGPKLGSFFNNMSGDFSTITMDRWFMRTFGRTIGSQLGVIAKNVMAKKDARLKQALKSYKGDILQKAKLPNGTKDPRQIAEALGKYFQKDTNRKNLSKQENEIRLAANDLFKVADGFELNEAPENGTHRRWIRAVMTDAITKFNAQTKNPLVPAEAQALLWYYEKLVHETYGSRQKDASPDYASAANKLFIRERGVGSDRFRDSDGIKRRSGGGRSATFGSLPSSSQSSATNYSIASQSEIDRVNRALGGMNRGPDERLKVYQRAKQKFSRVMQENKEELDAIRSSVSTNTAPAIEQIEMDRAGRIADIEAEENTEVAKALQDNADTFLPRIEAAPTPAERKRVERDAKDRAKILEQGIRDKYAERKKSTDAEAKSQRDQTLQAAAAKDSAANARMREKVRQTKLVDAIGELDGILEALPPEVRGRVGGFAVLANIGTGDKALADFFVKRIDMIDRQLERTLKEEYGNVFDALLERTKPKKAAAGEKPKGIGADIQSLFAVVREARDWSAEKVDGHIAGIETQIASGNLTAQEEAMLTREADLVSLVGDWKNADSSRRAAALSAATETWAKGMSTFVQKKIREREERDMARAEAISATGKKGDYVDRRKRDEKDNGVKGQARGWYIDTISWDQVVGVQFGHESPMAIRLSDGQRKAEYAKIDGIQAKEDAVHDLFTKLAGGKRVDGERLMWNMSQPSISANGLNLSELEALSATMLWAQEDGRRHMIGELDENGNPTSDWHYNQQFIDDIESQLSPEAKTIRDFLLNAYGKEWFAINSVYRELNGVNLPRIPNYSPVTVTPINIPSGMVTDPVTGNAVSATSISPGALRNRGVAIAEPNFRNVIHTYIAHTRQMEHWKAFSPWIKEANGILRFRKVHNAMHEASGGESSRVIGLFLDAFAQGGNRDASLGLEISKTMGGMASRAAQVALVGRVGTLAIQATQIGAASAELPVGAYLSRLGKLVTGNLGWGDAINSKYIQRRIKQMPVTVQIAMEGLRAGKPNQLKHQVEKIGRLIGGSDALWTAGTYAMVYDYQLGQAKALGYTGKAAEDYAENIADRITDRLAQPTRMGTRSIYEITTTNPAARLAWAFASESRKNLALLAYTKANRPLKRFLAATAGYVVFNLAMGALIRNAWKDMRDDGDDEDDFFDEKTWNWKRMGVAMFTEPLQGMPLLGDYTEKGINAALGQYHQSSDLINFERGIKSFKNIPDILQGERDAEGVLKDIDGMVSLMGLFNQNAAAAASLTHIASDFFGVVDNATTED